MLSQMSNYYFIIGGGAKNGQNNLDLETLQSQVSQDWDAGPEDLGMSFQKRHPKLGHLSSRPGHVFPKRAPKLGHLSSRPGHVLPKRHPKLGHWFSRPGHAFPNNCPPQTRANKSKLKVKMGRGTHIIYPFFSIPFF